MWDPTQQLAPELFWCKTHYPIFLVHGIAWRDDTPFLSYWGKIPDILKYYGADVHLSGHDAFNTDASSALVLKHKIFSLLRESKAKKVNIIAHSKGGLVARYMISLLGMEEKVASLTTLGTPHQGSSIADLLLQNRDNRSLLVKSFNLMARIFGDKNPNSFLAGQELTLSYMKNFNQLSPDKKDVYYQSFAGIIDQNYKNLFYRKLYKLLFEHEGANDGLVSEQSARWGHYRGIITDAQTKLVSHTDMVGQYFLSGVKDFDAGSFFVKLVHELKTMNF